MNLAVTGPAKSLVITGPIAVDNTRLVGFDVSSKIHGIAALSGVKAGDTTEIEKLRVNVRVTNGGIVANDIYSVMPAVGELNGSGTISAANQLDFNLVAKVYLRVRPRQSRGKPVFRTQRRFGKEIGSATADYWHA